MATSAHPRRRTQKDTGSQVTPSSGHPAMTLRSGTFSARCSISSDLCSPLDNARFMPRRSPTNPKTLEQLLIKEEASMAARKDDVAKLLRKFDDELQGRSSKDVDASSLVNDQQVLAVPRFMLDQTVVPDPMDVDEKKPVEEEDHHHDSDSGIGSSVSSPTIGRRTRSSVKSTISSTHTAITKSSSSLGSSSTGNSNNSTTHFLSEEAIRHIQKNIVKPILREPTLKEFHPLVEDIPRRIGAKFISNLRDLEKTLFFLAPDFTSSPSSFLKFCETSIKCLHTTVDHLCERDQRLPTDRPYTNNYFLDLVEQIRRYAEIMARTREKQAKGEDLDEMDYTRDEKIVVKGGLSNNGKPVELVRKKNGKTIPIIPESSRAAQEQAMSSSSSKHVLTDDELDDDDVLRSMARRRKSDKAGDVMQVCSVCRKEFKRPCDLTKHEKTHSRPWKCTDPKCRYHDLGWPTEKERDRHVNDKHSSAPRMFKCEFPPCTYASKRESNCKQHMEKAHNWEYVRSKSNGRKKSDSATASGSNQSPSTPLTPYIATPASANQTLSSPESGLAQSPWTNFGDSNLTPASMNAFYHTDTSRRESITTAGTFSSGFSPEQAQMFLESVSPTGQPDFNSPAFAIDANLDLNFSESAIQQPTPPLSIGHDFNNHNNLSGLPFDNNFDTNTMLQHLSPTGQGDLTLLSPHMDLHIDEGFGDDMGFGQDFTLYDSSSANTNMPTDPSSGNWFPDVDLGNVSGQYDPFNFSTDGYDHPFLRQQ